MSGLDVRFGGLEVRPIEVRGIRVYKVPHNQVPNKVFVLMVDSVNTEIRHSLAYLYPTMAGAAHMIFYDDSDEPLVDCEYGFTCRADVIHVWWPESVAEEGWIGCAFRVPIGSVSDRFLGPFLVADIRNRPLDVCYLQSRKPPKQIAKTLAQLRAESQIAFRYNELMDLELRYLEEWGHDLKPKWKALILDGPIFPQFPYPEPVLLEIVQAHSLLARSVDFLIGLVKRINSRKVVRHCKGAQFSFEMEDELILDYFVSKFWSEKWLMLYFYVDWVSEVPTSPMLRSYYVAIRLPEWRTRWKVAKFRVDVLLSHVDEFKKRFGTDVPLIIPRTPSIIDVDLPRLLPIARIESFLRIPKFFEYVRESLEELVVDREGFDFSYEGHVVLREIAERLEEFAIREARI